jgi:hypothetical protein
VLPSSLGKGLISSAPMSLSKQTLFWILVLKAQSRVHLCHRALPAAYFGLLSPDLTLFYLVHSEGPNVQVIGATWSRPPHQPHPRPLCPSFHPLSYLCFLCKSYRAAADILATWPPLLELRKNASGQMQPSPMGSSHLCIRVWWPWCQTPNSEAKYILPMLPCPDCLLLVFQALG